MAWVPIIDVDSAVGNLQEMYQRVKERASIVANIAKVQSLRPKTPGTRF